MTFEVGRAFDKNAFMREYNKTPVTKKNNKYLTFGWRFLSLTEKQKKHILAR
jgi:hypothetical protein